MSDRLTFFAQGRRRRLYRMSHNGPFYVRFLYKGKDHPRCLGTTFEHLAKDKAKAIIDAVYKGDLEESRRLKMASDYSTLRDICYVYRVRYGTNAKRKRSAQTNIGALEAMVMANGIGPLNMVRSDVLTGRFVRRFEEKQEERIERDGAGNMLQSSELTVRSYTASRVKQAKSIFKRSWMSWYEGLSLPDLTKFREQGVTAPKRPKPRPLDEGVMEAILKDAPNLEARSPALYVTFLLFSQLGLRNGEIKAARRSWIRRHADGSGELGVIYRPEENYEPKAKTEGWVPINAAVLAELDRIYFGNRKPETGKEEDDFLVPAANKTERAKIVDRQHSKWCGQWIKERSKVSYELRRYAGSLYYQQTRDLGKVQKFLRHADLKTTMDWYWYLLEKLEPMATPAWLETAPHLKVVA